MDDSDRDLLRPINEYARKVVRARRDQILRGLDLSNPSGRETRTILISHAREWIHLLSDSLLEDFDD